MMKGLPGRKILLYISSGIPDVSTRLTVMLTSGQTAAIDPRTYLTNVRIPDPFDTFEKKSYRTGQEAIKAIIRYANAESIPIYSLDPGQFANSVMPGTVQQYSSS
ncbi:MAG: hypothetical protein JXB23_13370 [Candidatus Aminicenantes bacterium]|nr:hypothetical protein [Candidatus Aminicenantes bacterium]